jgi:hypothetical protein
MTIFLLSAPQFPEVFSLPLVGEEVAVFFSRVFRSGVSVLSALDSFWVDICVAGGFCFSVEQAVYPNTRPTLIKI